MATNKQAVERRLPIRRCSGCGERFAKNTLVRVLRTPEGEITLDLTGKRSGRGAYICKSATCLKKARKARRIEQALECAIPESVYDGMEAEIARAE